MSELHHFFFFFFLHSHILVARIPLGEENGCKTLPQCILAVCAYVCELGFALICTQPIPGEKRGEKKLMEKKGSNEDQLQSVCSRGRGRMGGQIAPLPLPWPGYNEKRKKNIEEKAKKLTEKK